LIENNISFQEYKLGKDFTREILLSKFPSAKSFPVIVIDGFYIGGYTELNEHISLNHANSTEVFLTE
jgi:glutaredoxin